MTHLLNRMAERELFLSCKKGDLSKLQHLVEECEVELNIRDKWDGTPLYYACLCGHEDVVKYLLMNGVRCEANTFDGERCLYGALSNEIRALLKSFHVVTSTTIRRELYEEFLRRLQEDGCYADIVFHVQGEEFPAHRCILSARSLYFAEMLETKWHNRRDVHLTNKMVLPKAFQAILQYLYTARLETHIDYLEDCILVARQCRLEKLIAELEAKLKRIISFESTKPGVNVTMICVEQSPDSDDLQQSLGQLADFAFPPELCNCVFGELPFEPETSSFFPDVCFQVQKHSFLCHQAFFCGRSDYFKALLNDPFGESESSLDNMSHVTLHNISAEIFVIIVYYIYQDSCTIAPDQVYDVLYFADMYLLPGLKKLCATVIGRFIMSENVITILRTARLFNLPRLQNQCYEYIANNIEKMVDQEDFAEVIQEDACTVQGREETDTIDIVDEVRYFITNFIQTFSDVEEANEKLCLIDHLLEKLNLDG